VAVAGFVHVHVHGVFVPYTRRREASAQPVHNPVHNPVHDHSPSPLGGSAGGPSPGRVARWPAVDESAP
jgi:hypothetical protein